MPRTKLPNPETYDQAYANARTLLIDYLQGKQEEHVDTLDEDVFWDLLEDASYEFYDGEFDLDWCVGILKSRPGLSEERTDRGHGRSVEEVIFDLIRERIYDDLAVEFREDIDELVARQSAGTSP
jgi:hypothetical protein